MTSWIEIGLAIVVTYLVLAPPKYDPAIRLKHWLNKEKFPNEEYRD